MAKHSRIRTNRSKTELAVLGLLAVAVVVLAAVFVFPCAEPSRSSSDASSESSIPGEECPVDLSDLPAPPPPGEEIAFIGAHPSSPGMPTVRAEYMGCVFRVLVDTGVTGGNALMGWFARRLKLETHPGKRTAFDIAGRVARVLEIDWIQIEVPSLRTTVPIQMVEPGPGDRLMEDGIAGIISPRYTVADGRILILEFGPRSRLRNLSIRDAESLHQETPTFDLRECEGHFQSAALVGGHPARLEIDTGSMGPVIYSESAAGRPLAAQIMDWRETKPTALGGPQRSGVVAGVPIRVGELAATATIEIMRTKGNTGEVCGFDGVLGTDFLASHRCTLLAQVDRMRGYCTP